MKRIKFLSVKRLSTIMVVSLALFVLHSGNNISTIKMDEKSNNSILFSEKGNRTVIMTEKGNLANKLDEKGNLAYKLDEKGNLI